MLSPVWKVVLCAAQLKLATVGFSHVGLSDAQASFYAEHFSVQLQRAGDDVRVTTPKDLETVLGVEKQKQLLGCADESSSCMAEIANALGAAGLVTGQIAKVGQSYQLNVKILAPEGTKALFLYSSKLLKSEEELVEELNAVALQAVTSLREQAPVVEAPQGAQGSAPPPRARSKLKLIPAAAGGLAFAVGVVALIQSGAQYAKLSNAAGWGSLSAAEALTVRNSGRESLAVGLTLAIAGAVIVVASVLWYLLT